MGLGAGEDPQDFADVMVNFWRHFAGLHSCRKLLLRGEEIQALLDADFSHDLADAFMGNFHHDFDLDDTEAVIDDVFKRSKLFEVR